MEQWKEKANKLQQKYDDLMSQKNELNAASLQLQEHNKELTARNEQLEYSMPQLNLENEHLREQIQNMIIASNEATRQHHRISGLQHSDNSNQLGKLFQAHFWVILVTFNDVPPIQLTPPQNRMFEPLTIEVSCIF